jgi:ubiquinone/menaquinone biosynthesis C-methylase UbiE
MKMTKIEKKFVNSKKHAEKNFKIFDELFTQLDSSGINKVLEIGCGIGAVASYLSDKYGMNVIGTDVDPEQIELARTHFTESRNLQFLEANATKLPLEDIKFDMVLSLNIFHHISDWRGVLSEVSRLLKTKGFFLFSDLAYPKIAAIIFTPFIKNYGIYTIEDIIHVSQSNDLNMVFRKRPSGIMMAQQSLVFQKG